MKGCFARGWSHEAKLQLRTVETITSPLDLRPHTRLANQSTRKLLELFFSLRESDSAALAWDQRALCEKVSQVSVRISQIREPWSQASISCRDQQFHGMLVSGLKKKKKAFCSQRNCFLLEAFTMLRYMANFQDRALICKHIWPQNPPISPGVLHETHTGRYSHLWGHFCRCWRWIIW